jgi:aryl-alcohol dehydrogenase-like predicted oxidoreductase
MQVGDVQMQPDGTPGGKRVNDVSAKRVPLSLEASLRRLKTEHVDIYLYHSPPDRNEADAVARYLESAKQKGHVRAIGISTAKFEFAEYLQSIGCLDVVQFPENMIDRQPEFRSLMTRHNVGGILRGAFAGGRLSGKYFHQPPEFGAQDIRGTRLKPQDFGKYAVLEKLAVPGRTVAQTALRWLLDQPSTHTIILGAKTFSEYRDAALATESPVMNESEKSQIDAMRLQLVG